MDQSVSEQWDGTDRLIEELIEREGGYVNHPSDKGGPTRFGITEAVARAHGYSGPDGAAAARRSGGDLPPAVLAENDGLSLGAKDLTLQERLIATEQAIQLDELIKWVNGQAAVGSQAEPARTD